MTSHSRHRPDQQACQWLPNLQVHCSSGASVNWPRIVHEASEGLQIA